jgi:hypothetical protein
MTEIKSSTKRERVEMLAINNIGRVPELLLDAALMCNNIRKWKEDDAEINDLTLTVQMALIKAQEIQKQFRSHDDPVQDQNQH